MNATTNHPLATDQMGYDAPVNICLSGTLSPSLMSSAPSTTSAEGSTTPGETKSKWIRVEDGAKLTGVSRNTIRNWIPGGNLPDRWSDDGRTRWVFLPRLLELVNEKKQRKSKSSCAPPVSQDVEVPDIQRGDEIGQQPIVKPDFEEVCNHNDSHASQAPVETTARHVGEELSAEESNRLKACENAVKDGLTSFVEVGTALMEIRDNKLYRQTHKTFESYVQSVLALSRPRAYELMDSAQVMAELSGIPDISRLPLNEGQATELRRWKTPEERSEKWKAVLAAAGEQTITAKFIRQTLKPTPSPVATSNPDVTTRRIKADLARLRKDVTGTPYDEKAMPLIAELEQLFAK